MQKTIAVAAEIIDDRVEIVGFQQILTGKKGSSRPFNPLGVDELKVVVQERAKVNFGGSAKID